MSNPIPKPAPKEKSPRKPLKSNSLLKTKSRIKQTYDPIPNKVKDEVDERDGLICQDCGSPVKREEGPYHHIDFRSQQYNPLVRLWSGQDYIMAPRWYQLHSKENIITLCPWKCHPKPHSSREERYRWEKWRDTKYKGEC